jgi:hypothetical protein
MSRKLTNEENKKIKVELKYGEKHGKTYKMKNTHCRTWKMARNSEKREKGEMHTVGTGIWREN